MKNSTFSAQVANNLLTLLQGYSKTIRLLLVMFLTLTVTTNAWGAEYSYTFSAKQFSANGSKTLNNVSWTLAGDGGYWGYDGTKGQQFGSGNKPYKTLTLSTSGISGTITKIIINTSGGSSVNASFTVSVGGTQWGNSTKLTATATAYTFTGSNSGEMKFSYTQTSSKALYIKSIIVTYETAAATVPVTGVSLDKTKLTLTEGSSETLTATVLPNNATDKTITWSTSNSSVATVSDGKVTAVAEGSAIITVTTNDGKKTATCNVTVNPKPKYTVTLVPGSGTCAASVTESSAGAGVTLPTPTLDGCGEWSFAGWTTSSVANETSSKPATLLTGTYKPTANTTLYAVYQRTEETEGNGGTENVSRSYTFSNFTAGTQYAKNEVHKLDDDVTLITTDCHFTSELRMYSSNTNNGYVVSNKLPGRIISIGFNAGNKVDKIAVYGSTNETAWTEVGQVSVTSTSYKDYTLNFGETNYTYFKLDVVGSNQVRLKSITITWESTTAGGTIITTYYHSTPDCGDVDPEPTGYTITFEANHGTKIDKIENATTLPNPLPETERAHYTFAGWFTDEGCTQAATAGATINADITLYAKWTPVTYTVTFDAGSGTYTSGDIQGNFETGLELPTATPCPYASTNGWSFVGWSESTVSETTVRPAIHTGNYKPTDNITLHAVYAKIGTAEGAAGEFILSLQYEGTTYYVGQTFDNNKLSAETEQTNAARFTIEDNYLHYEGGYISHVATTSSPNITKQADKANAKAWTITTEEANTVIFTSTADNTRGLGFNYNSGSPRFAAYQLSNDDYPHTFTKTSVSGGNVQVTTYNSKPSCEAPVDPNWVAATITHTAIKANCGSTTVLGSEGENGPATISFSGTDLQNSVTVTASDGFLVSTDKKAPEKYAQSVIIYPNSTGNNIGKITQNVHVIANATAKNESYTGTITLRGNDIPDGGEQVINVTAAVTCTQYTITWSVNGDDSHKVTYSPSDALQLPEIDITPCDGMDHVGWTDNMGYVPGTDILFTETTDMTVTSDKTYYAVFATPTSSGGGETTTTLNFSQQGYANQEKVTSLEIGGVTVSFSQGEASDPPAYYNTGTAIRVYAKGSFTVSSTNTISQIEITFGTGDGTNEISTNVGDYSDGTWKGSANEIIFTVGGDSKHRRIKSIAVTSAGGGASYYTGHTTTCSGSQQLATPTNLQAADITHNGATLTWDAVAGANKYKVVINGTEYISNINSYTTHDLKPQTAYTWTVQAIGNGTTFTDSEISAEATFPTGTALTITWSVSTVTSTTTITKGQPIGANLKTPATPAACEGKDFMGWSASSTVKSDGSDFTPITSDIVPETNVTYYAVFATKEVGDGVALTQCNGSTTFNAGDNIVIVASGDESGDDWSYLCYQETSGTTYIAYSDFTNDAATLIKDNKNYWTLETATNGFYLGDVTNGYMYIAPSSNNMSVSSTNKSVWTIEWNVETEAFNIKSDRWLSCRHDLNDNKYKWRAGGANNTDGTLNLQVYKINGNTNYTNYSTSCGTYTVTFYGFNSGGYTTICNDNPTEIAVAQGGTYVIPNCEPTFDPAKLGRTFAGTWNTKANGKGTPYKPGDEITNVSNDITLYAQWALNTSGNITLPTDVEDLATTDVVVTGGTTLTLQTGTTTINSLTLKGGIQADGRYKMPIINIPDNATLKRKSDIIYLDLVVNAKNYYPFAVPFRAKNGSDKDNWDYVGYIDPDLKDAATYRTHFVIKTYDGAKRAENGENRDANWVIVNRDTYLEPGIGYMITAMTAGKDAVTMRIPMRVSDDWFAGGEQTTLDEVTRNTVPVTAHTGTATDINKGGHQRHAGWNFVANPYLSNFTGGTNPSNVEGSFINGEIIINNGEYDYGGDDVPYVTIPAYDFAHYDQVKLSDATLSPAYSFFVQVGKSGTMTFETAGRQQAPASIAARNAEERPVKMDVDITLSDNHSSDQTGIIISDRYNDTYEIGRDLEKLFGSAYNLSVYTLMADNTPLAFQALAIRSNMQVIPVGYRTPAQGEYTFRLNEATSSIDLLNEQYEQLVLVDYQTGELTNLLIADYTFYSERTQADNRFAIYAVPRQNAPTDLPNAIGQDKQAQKIIHNGHLYILRDGNVYNGNGQIVK